MTRVLTSPYLEWAKLHSTATWNLATSGVPHASLADLGVGAEQLPLSGPNAYGYAPLLERIAAHHGVEPVDGDDDDRLLDGELPDIGRAGQSG